MAEISLRLSREHHKFPGTLYSDHLEFTLRPVLPEGSAVALRSRSEAAFVAEGAALV